ncbi:MAG: TerB family tellurite resistance protein [Nitrospirota bacterium]
MLNAIQEFFDARIRSTSGQPESLERALQLATAALLVEVSRADHEIKDEERRVIGEAVRRTFNLSEHDTDLLVRLAEEEAQTATSTHQFTHLIDRHFPTEQKVHIVELLWRVAFADANKDRHEEHLIRRIADLLHVPHREFIDAKVRARDVT